MPPMAARIGPHRAISLAAGLAALLALATGCGGLAGSEPARIQLPHQAPHGDSPAPWTSLDVRDDPGRFHFVVLSDRTGAHRPGVYESAIEKVNLLQPALVMSVGDQIEGYTEDEARLDAEWLEIESFVKRLDMPYFYTAGNHDMGNRVMLRAWSERFGPSYYHFTYKDVLFLVLNSELFPGAAGGGRDFATPDEQARQMAYVEAALREHRDVRWTFVFLHQPFWEMGTGEGEDGEDSGVNPDWRRVEAWLEGRPHTVFAGHLHRYHHEERHGHDRITLATTGGASALRGIEYGEFDHVAWVTMTERGPVIANLLLDGIRGKRLPVGRDAAQRAALRDIVDFEPIRTEGSVFRTGTQGFSLRNETTQPVTVTARVESSGNLKASPPAFERVLGPGESAELDVRLAAEDALPVEELSPVRVRWTLRSEAAAGGARIRSERRTPLVPQRAFPVRPARAPIAVDGRLDEWPRLRFAGESPAEVRGNGFWDGPADGSLRFDVAADAEFVYFAIDVTDDVLRVYPDVLPVNQDGVLFSVDPRPDPERSANGSLRETVVRYGPRAIVFTGFSPPPEEGGERVAMFEKFWPDGLRGAAVRTTGGYAVEVALPVAYLDAAQQGRWEAFRLNLGVADADAPDDHTNFWWRPDRFSENAIPGTGTFVREPRGSPAP